MGKGSKRRPNLVPDEQVSENWDKIFNNLANSKPNKHAIDVIIGTDQQNERINKHKK